MTDTTPIRIDEPYPPTSPVQVAHPPRLPSPADCDSPRARPKSDPDLWVAVATELAE